MSEQRGMGLEIVEEQSFARIYRVAGRAFIRTVSGERGFHRPQEKNAVLVTLMVNDVHAWCEKITAAGMKIMRPMMVHKDINIRCFFFSLKDRADTALKSRSFWIRDCGRYFIDGVGRRTWRLGLSVWWSRQGVKRGRARSSRVVATRP